MAMKNEDHYRKIGILIPVELYNRLNKCFEWGERTRVLTNILEWTCDKIEKHGSTALIAFLREKDFGKLVNMGLQSSNTQQEEKSKED